MFDGSHSSVSGQFIREFKSSATVKQWGGQLSAAQTMPICLGESGGMSSAAASAPLVFPFKGTAIAIDDSHQKLPRALRCANRRPDRRCPDPGHVVRAGKEKDCRTRTSTGNENSLKSMGFACITRTRARVRHLSYCTEMDCSPPTLTSAAWSRKLRSLIG